jgi:hypothetical protein
MGLEAPPDSATAGVSVSQIFCADLPSVVEIYMGTTLPGLLLLVPYSVAKRGAQPSVVEIYIYAVYKNGNQEAKELTSVAVTATTRN